MKTKKDMIYEELNRVLPEDLRGFAIGVYEHIITKTNSSNLLLKTYLPVARSVMEKGGFSCSVDGLGDFIVEYIDEHIDEEIIDVLERSRTNSSDPFAEYLVKTSNDLVEHLEEKYPLRSK